MGASRSVITLAVGVSIALAIPATSRACSKVGFQGVRSANTAHFIGTPTADTVFAGAGSVRHVLGPGHSGPAGTREVFGQVVSVERIGGLASRGLRQPAQVVLVPWDYAPDCVPTHWMRSAAWVPPGTRGHFIAVLRDSAHWAGGVPTFDVFTPQFQPYPRQVQRQMRRRSSPPADSIVTIEELFQLMEFLPDAHLVLDSAEAATEQLFAWARANPTLTRRYPVADVLSHARRMVARQRLHAVRSPLTGTWQMTLSLSGAPARTFYARTHGFPTSEWMSNPFLRREIEDPTIVPRSDGYYLLTSVAESLAALPRSCERGRGLRREGYMVVVYPPPDSASDARMWNGKLEISLAKSAFATDSALNQFSLPAGTPARFAQSADGTIRVEQVITLEDGRSLTMNGTRISSDIVACQG